MSYILNKKNKLSSFFVLLSFLFFGTASAQDDFIPPSEFEYQQSRFQAFYFFLDGDIGGIQLDEGDWIGIFNDDICVGSWPWQG